MIAQISQLVGPVWQLNVGLRGSRMFSDQGDGPWNGELPPKALAEIAQADDGEVFEMAADPWW